MTALVVFRLSSPGAKGDGRKGRTITVGTITPLRKDLEVRLGYTADITPNQVVNLFSRVDGYISKIHVDWRSSVARRGIERAGRRINPPSGSASVVWHMPDRGFGLSGSGYCCGVKAGWSIASGSAGSPLGWLATAQAFASRRSLGQNRKH